MKYVQSHQKEVKTFEKCWLDNAVTCANIRVGKNYLMGPKNEVTVGYLSDPLLGLTMEPALRGK